MNQEIQKNITNILENMPSDWLDLTTHRLDIYNEKQAKVEFLNELKTRLSSSDETEITKSQLDNLPTSFDYIRLGHPLSCVLEWAVGSNLNLNDESVISFSSQSMPIFAILRKNLLENRQTRITYQKSLPENFDLEVIQNVYGYQFALEKVDSYEALNPFDGSSIHLIDSEELWQYNHNDNIDFIISLDANRGSICLVLKDSVKNYISEIQHVRRRESIAMTPIDCYEYLSSLINKRVMNSENNESDREKTQNVIKSITSTSSNALLGSSGLSIQYAIMMGLIHHCLDHHKGKKIKFIVPPNCYGGTNDQARRVAQCIENVEILDLPVDGGKDMVDSVEKVLDHVASIDAIPFIIAEIPTNPRVEVPDLNRLKEALGKKRETTNGATSIEPVFILDQTFCPNVKFLGESDYLSSVKTISYVSGSKFPSGGKVTAGYCVANQKAKEFLTYIEKHLQITENKATSFQVKVLASQMPSMLTRIDEAYKNTRSFVDFISETLPEAKINFVSHELADSGFTPSVFSLDLPTKGETAVERESFKRDLNLKLINSMIDEIPHESKYCVSYGQLNGCYWTIPATSTQGTTKEGDKDYIVRVSISPKFDLDLHKKVFAQFCADNY